METRFNFDRYKKNSKIFNRLEDDDVEKEKVEETMEGGADTSFVSPNRKKIPILPFVSENVRSFVHHTFVILSLFQSKMINYIINRAN